MYVPRKATLRTRWHTGVERSVRAAKRKCTSDDACDARCDVQSCANAGIATGRQLKLSRFTFDQLRAVRRRVDHHAAAMPDDIGLGSKGIGRRTQFIGTISQSAITGPGYLSGAQQHERAQPEIESNIVLHASVPRLVDPTVYRCASLEGCGT